MSTYDPVAALTGASSAARTADPKTIVGAVKASSSYHEAITNVQAIAAYGNTSKLFNTLSHLQPSVQAAAWQGFSPAERDRLSAVGYQVPNLDALTHVGAGGDHGGIWSAIASGFHTVAHWAATGYDYAKHTVVAGVDKTLSVLGAPLRAVQHLYRAEHYRGVETVAAHRGWTYAVKKAQAGGVTVTGGWADIFSPSAWAHAWRMTTTGNTTLTPALGRALNARFGRTTVQLGLRVMRQGATAIVAATPSKNRPQLVAKLTDPRFKQLVGELQNATISLGRNAVGLTYLTKHPLGGKLASGGIDAAFDVAATPLNALGKAASAARVAKFGITDGEVGAYLAGDASKMDSILSSPSYLRYTDHVGRYLENGDYAGLARFDPRLDKVVSKLAAEGIDSADKFGDWMSGEAGLYAVLAGDAARVSKGVAIVPHLTIGGWLKAGVKEALQSGIDRLADGKVQGLDSIELDHPDVAGVGDLAHQDTVARRAQSLEELLNSGEATLHGPRIPGVSDLARLVRRMSTLIQTRPFVDIGTDSDISNLRRFLQGFLPAKRVDEALDIYLHSDVGTRYRIVAAARQQMLHAFGLYSTPDGHEMADKLLGALEDMERHQTYSVGGLDQLATDEGISLPSAVLENQLSQRMALPMPNQIRKTVREMGLLGKLHLNPMIAATRFMYLWRSLILDRPGFAVRFSLTENLLRLLRTGPRKFIGSYLAQGAAHTEDPEDVARTVDALVASGDLAPAERDAEIAGRLALANKPIFPYHPVERALSILAERVPEGLRPYVETPAQFYGAVLGATTRKWARQAERSGLRLLGLEDYITAATHLVTHQHVAETFQDAISAMHGTEGMIWTPGGIAKASRDASDTAVAEFRQSSHYAEAAPNDPLWRLKWQFALDQVAQSQLGQAVLHTMDKTPRTQENAVLRVLNDPSFADLKSQFARASRLPDGRVVGVDATQREADLAFARVVRKHVNALVRSGDPERGPVLSDLVDEMRVHGRGPAAESLDAVDQRDLPASVFGPDILRTDKHEGLFSKSWETLVGKPANWLARQPHFIQAYAEALPSAREWAAATGASDAEKLASDLATERAVNAVLPFIHNPQLRTQFEDQHRILFPFLFAQRQFIQRWARLVADSPDAIRKIQLTMNGLRSVGFIKKDPTTNQTYFYYPLSEYPQMLVTHVLTALGIKSSIPMGVPFTGEVQYLMPGLSNPVMPSVGPFATVSIEQLARIFPQLSRTEKVLGGQGSTTPEWQQFTPTLFNRIWTALPFNQRGSELASATMQAIKYLDAAGFSLPNNPTPEEVTRYVRRLKNWSMSLLMMRATLGFMLPATPKATLDPKGLDARWHTLLNQLTYTQATAEFIREHPTATAYTVGETQNVGDGYTPATKASLDWLEAHAAFAKAHPLAASWFIPRSSGTYTPTAFREQLALGMRSYRTVSSTSPSTPGFLQDVIKARVANEYWATWGRYEQAYTSTTSSKEHQTLANWWNTWKSAFFKQNPVFGRYVMSGEGHIRRLEVIDDVARALSTPDVPPGQQTDEMRTVVGTYERFVSAYTANVSRYSTAITEQRRTLKAATVAWLATYAQRHPQVADFINTVVRIEVQDQK